jgi:hypothetical protein
MKITSWRVIFFAGISALLIIYLVWWGRMIANPTERNSTDFIALYSAGRVAQTHGFPHIYDIELQQKFEQDIVGFQLADGQVLLFIHPPYIVPLLTMVIDNNYVRSFKHWALILICMYLAGTLFLVNSLFANVTTEVRFILLSSTLTFSPLFISIWQGQDTALVYLGVIFWCIGILKKQDWLISVGLVLTTIRPHICIALAMPLFFRYQMAWWRSILLISILAVLSVLLVNIQGTVGFLNLIRISSEGSWFGIRPEAMFNLLGFILRIVQFPNSGIASFIGWVIYLAGVITICGLWLRSKIINGRLLGLSVLITIVTAPHLHLHDLTLLIFPLLFVVNDRITSPASQYWAMLLLGTSLFLVIGILLDVVTFILPYMIFITLAWLLVYRDLSPQELQIHNNQL